MIKIKPGVKFLHASFLWPDVIRMIYIAQKEAPVGYEMTITSACDGEHKANSSHYRGRAIDIRIRDLPKDASAKTWARRIQGALGNNYFVLLESNHIHIQANCG